MKNKTRRIDFHDRSDQREKISHEKNTEESTTVSNFIEHGANDDSNIFWSW